LDRIDIGWALAHQAPTAPSNNASRHISTRGKSSAGGKLEARLAVVTPQLANSGASVDAGFCAAFPEEAHCDLRSGRTDAERVRFAFCLSKLDKVEASIKKVNFVWTASKVGTCLNRMGSVERLSTDGIERAECGCAGCNF